MKALRNRLPERYDLIPAEALRRVALQFGSGAYPDTNFVDGLGDPEYLAECANHLESHWQRWKAGDRSEDHLAKMMFGGLVLMSAPQCDAIDPTARVRSLQLQAAKAPVVVKQKRTTPKTEPAKSAPSPRKESSSKRGEKPAAILALLRTSPLTTAEIGAHIYPDLSTKQRYDNTIAMLGAMRKKDLVERRECPQSRIDKWYPTEEASAA